MIDGLSIAWPPFSQPEGLVAATTSIWLAAIAAGALVGLGASGRRKHRTWSVAIAAGLLVAAVVLYAQFNAERMITFRADEGGEESTLLLPLQACSTSAQFAPGGPARDLAIPDDLRALAERPACRIGMMTSNTVYLVLTTTAVFLSTLLLFAALGGLVGDRRLLGLLGRIRDLLPGGSSR